MTGPRHLLVIGAQCPGLGLLDALEEATHALHDTLTTPWAGACAPGPAPGPTLLYGRELTRQDVESAVRAAGRAAAEAGAVLVLAFLGHGMAAGTELYFMAGDSQAEQPLTAVNLSALLGDLADTPGLDGLVALVDTCHAGHAVPDLSSLAAGIRRGETRLSLLMGAAADEEAYALRFSTTVAKVLRDGVADAGEALTGETVVHAVRAAGGAAGQAVQHAAYDGAQFAPGPLWLARNARHTAARPGAPLGPVGRAALDQALAPLGGAPDPEGPTRPEDFTALRERAGRLPAAERDWAYGVLDNLRDAARTVHLLTAWPGQALTSPLLRRTLVASVTTVEGAAPVDLPETTGAELLRDIVEHLLLRAPRARGGRTAPLAAFLAHLARCTGVDPHHTDLRAWAKETGAVIDLNDAFATLTARTEEMRLRLVVSLHAAVGDEWPESLAAWLLDGGEVRRHEEFACPAQDRAGTERALGTVLRWAATHARALGTPLRRVEIAAPAPLLATWRPEETHVGMRLGARYDVVLRWSDRIHPPDHLWWINDQARDTLKAIEESADGDRVDWFGEADTRRVSELRERLENAPRTRAAALAHRPAQLAEFVATLLSSSPIVLWPDDRPDSPADPATDPAAGPVNGAGSGSVPDHVRRCVDTHWHQLPGAFIHAYRSRWSQAADPAAAGTNGSHHLARLRTVWDGPEWLDFCTWFDSEHIGRDPFASEGCPTEGEQPA
ncbi:hypothetical protein SLA_6572 [Streptomyces laurentii]|uniref:Caspase domain-containing protein n=1 Tax=Streptomyces laurentii TaxID=39478 RepID=A0A169PDZ5_STRLU|nr:hypothetical protein SLA_6572 [Streptomyces laurentii]